MYACATLGLFVFSLGVFLSSRVTGACPVATDLIIRYCDNNNNNNPKPKLITNVRTTSNIKIYLVLYLVRFVG